MRLHHRFHGGAPSGQITLWNHDSPTLDGALIDDILKGGRRALPAKLVLTNVVSADLMGGCGPAGSAALGVARLDGLTARGRSLKTCRFLKAPFSRTAPVPAAGFRCMVLSIAWPQHW